MALGALTDFVTGCAIGFATGFGAVATGAAGPLSRTVFLAGAFFAAVFVSVGFFTDADFETLFFDVALLGAAFIVGFLAFFAAGLVALPAAFASAAFFLAADVLLLALAGLRLRPAFFFAAVFFEPDLLEPGLLELDLLDALAVRFADCFFAFAIINAAGKGFRKASQSRAWYMPRDRHD